MTKCISILGSTGSIGVQTLDVARRLNIKVCAIAAGKNARLAAAQAMEFKPRIVAMNDAEAAEELSALIDGSGIEVLSGVEGVIQAAVCEEAQTLVSAIVGTAGLIPTLEAIRRKKNIALANKETLVTAGKAVMDEIRANGVSLLPVDSEHSAIFQCLQGNSGKSIRNVILTASGGPFRGKTCKQLEKVTVSQALAHPSWNMGGKITIDSATLMNKGLEVIEAHWLFGVEAKNIKVVVHPQSIIHSMVEYVDGSILAQLGVPDMRIPIQYAFTWPERTISDVPVPDFVKIGRLDFEEPDTKVFPALMLAYQALKEGGTMPAVMNAANEAAVEKFLKGLIGFNDIARIIEVVMNKHITRQNASVYDIIEEDRKARILACQISERILF